MSDSDISFYARIDIGLFSSTQLHLCLLFISAASENDMTNLYNSFWKGLCCACGSRQKGFAVQGTKLRCWPVQCPKQFWRENMVSEQTTFDNFSFATSIYSGAGYVFYIGFLLCAIVAARISLVEWEYTFPSRVSFASLHNING